MNALGRGLASLIPRKNKAQAEEILEQIDAMEEIAPGVPNKKRSVTVEAEDDDVDTSPTTAEVPAAAPKRQVSVVEETEDQDIDVVEEELAPPKKPLVTPLSIDPDTGAIQENPSTPVPPADRSDRRSVPASHVRTTLSRKESNDATPEVSPASNASAQKAAVPTEDVAAELWDRHEDKVEHIVVGDIEVNTQQPRRDFAPEEMEELTQSIDQHGILQPLVVLRKTGGGYELVAGERRLRAAKKLGWEKVPCVVRTDARTDRGRLEMALIENIQRQDLNAVEEAMGYQRLHEEFGLTHEEIGGRVGKSRVAITNILRILQLPAEIQRGLADGKISPGHARAILMIPDDEKQIRFYHHLLDEGLTVRKAETRARRIQHQMKLNDPLRRKLRGRPQLALKYDAPLEEKYGYNARVKFVEQKNRFEVVFQAFSEKEAEELLGRLLGTEPLPQNVDEDVLNSDDEENQE